MIATAVERRDLIAEIDGAPKVITSDAQHERYVSALLELEGGERRGQLSAAGRFLAELLTVLVEKYEQEHHRIASASPVEVLRELMEANDLQQEDLTREFGTESIVSEVLSGKRKLNKDDIEKLRQRFHISPVVFFEASAPAFGAGSDKPVLIRRKARDSRAATVRSRSRR
jgi:HTH-type transcriptional regulator/antitoxin HigA